MSLTHRPDTTDDSRSRVCVVVVNYNTRDQLRRCLSSIESQHDVVVVDNASRDGSSDMVRAEFPRVKLIENATNRGFGAANNQGLDTVERPFALLLNSDAYARTGAIDLLAQFLDDPDVVAVGGRLVNPDGSVQNSSANSLTLWAVFCEQTLLERIFPNSRLFSPYWNTRGRTFVAETEQVMGACLMMKPVERFDERFFLYCEDTDLCRRLRRRGRILVVPDAVFEHDLGASSATNRWLAVSRYNRGKELYFRIHHGRSAAVACWALDRLGATARFVVWTLALPLKTRTAVDRMRLFWKVIVAPVGGYPPAS